MGNWGSVGGKFVDEHDGEWKGAKRLVDESSSSSSSSLESINCGVEWIFSLDINGE